MITFRARRVAAAASTLALAASAVTAAAAGTANASTAPMPRLAAAASNTGVNEFGMTKAYFNGAALNFTYTHGFFCDASVASAASTKCEVGVASKKAPSTQHDPLYITVPLGFSPKTMMECPARLVCVDHPATADLSRLEPALKGLYPSLTAAQLTAALKNFAVPGHDHFITDANAGKAEWWDVHVIGVTSPTVYASIVKNRSYTYISTLLKAKNKNVLGPIPTNIWLYFSVKAS